jgi:hypothetical protein
MGNRTEAASPHLYWRSYHSTLEFPGDPVEFSLDDTGTVASDCQRIWKAFTGSKTGARGQVHQELRELGLVHQ